MGESTPGAGDHKDAVSFSPHKFVGGPQTPGSWSSAATCPRNRVPTVPGGGTVAFVDPAGQRYLDDPVAREEGGTPGIVESVRAGLVVALKHAVGPTSSRSGHWRHRDAPPDPVLSLPDLLDGRPGPGPVTGGGDLAGHLERARVLLGTAGPAVPEAGPSWLPPELEHPRDFHLPPPPG